VSSKEGELGRKIPRKTGGKTKKFYVETRVKMVIYLFQRGRWWEEVQGGILGFPYGIITSGWSAPKRVGEGEKARGKG